MTDLIQRLKRLENLFITSQKQVLNIDEVCTYTGLSKSTIYKLCMRGAIPYYKQSKHNYFDKDEIITWLKETRGYNAEELKQNAHTFVSMKGGAK
nr:helix-turn-helix domain-containing protein [uncultured Carboxylicivirga sp.]